MVLQQKRKAPEIPYSPNVLASETFYDDHYDCYFSVDVHGRTVVCIPYDLWDKARGKRYWIFYTPRVLHKLKQRMLE